MKFSNLSLMAIAHTSSETIYSSDKIEELLAPLYDRLRLPSGRLELMTGIKNRHHYDRGVLPSTISAAAGEKLLRENYIDRNSIDLLIHASVCRDFLEPATASIVHRHLKLPPTCHFFDISNACLGVMNAITVAGSMIECGSIKKALIVSGENGGPLLHETVETLLNNPAIDRKSIKKYIANLTIGSAGVAILLGNKSDNQSKVSINESYFHADSEASVLCQGNGNAQSLMMLTDSEELLHAGIKLAKESFGLVSSKFKETTYNLVLTHQVGRAHEELLFKELPIKFNRTYNSYPEYGNTGSAALPLTLSLAASEGLIKKNDEILLLGIGSGLSTNITHITW